MKGKILKSYQVFEKEHIKENMMSLSNNSTVPSFHSSDENLKDIEECEECEQLSMALGTEEEKKIDMPIIAHVEIAQEIEIPINVVDTTITQVDNSVVGFDPAAIANKEPLKIFSIVKMMTHNGEKIGMCYTKDVGEYGTPIHNDIDFNAACELVKVCCSECGLGEFSNENDTIIGAIPSFMVSKKGNTSYIPK